MAIAKTKRGYQVRWYDAEGHLRKKTVKGITRDEAIRLEREILAARDRGERQPDVRRAPLFGAFAATWVEENRSGWKLSTLQQYRQVLKSQLLPPLADLRLGWITESRIQQLVTSLLDAGLSARRINLVLLVLKMILRTAVRRRLIRDDPATMVRKLKEPRTEIDPLGPEEVELFQEACPPWWRPYFTVSFWTGARPNELAALKWGDIDWARATFRVRAGRYRGVESTPKTAGSVRDVDMLPAVLEAMKLQKTKQAAARLKLGLGGTEPGADYIFTGPEGGLLNPNHLRDAVWYPTLKAAKLRRRTMYQTRHTFASNALAAGESPSWVAAMLGHTTPEMLFTVYARYIPNRTRRDGSAFAQRMTEQRERPKEATVALPK
jgi:integrase